MTKFYNTSDEDNHETFFDRLLEISSSREYAKEMVCLTSLNNGEDVTQNILHINGCTVFAFRDENYYVTSITGKSGNISQSKSFLEGITNNPLTKNKSFE